MNRILGFVYRHGNKVMGWFFLIGGSAIVLVLVVGLVYSIANGMGEAVGEFAIGVVLFGATPWIGLKMLRESPGSS
jgi:hypothetical protein